MLPGAAFAGGCAADFAADLAEDVVEVACVPLLPPHPTASMPTTATMPQIPCFIPAFRRQVLAWRSVTTNCECRSFLSQPTTRGGVQGAAGGVYLVDELPPSPLAVVLLVIVATEGNPKLSRRSTAGGNTHFNKTTANGLGSNSVIGVYEIGNTFYADVL